MANFETQLLLNLNELEFDTSKELTVEEIKKHYKKLSLYYHPDHNDNEIFKDKQKKINGAKEFLIDNLDEVNRYIRRVNHKETDEDKARAEKEQWQRDEQDRRAYYEQQARQKQASAKAEQEKARAEQKARDAEREAEAAKARAAEAEWRAHVAENERREAERKKKNVKTVIIALVAVFLILPFTVGVILSFVNGFNEGMAKDSESAAASDKESKTMQISDTNLPKTFVKGVKVNWSDYYVTYKDANGKEVKVVLSEGMMNIDYENFEEQQAEINVDNGSVYLYHKLTVLDSTIITDVSDLKSIADKPNGTYILDADIDLSGENWIPVSFEGEFVGNGHAIKNLTISSFSTKNVGLFDTIKENATVSDLKLENVSIVSSSTAESIGALAGMLEGKIENITVTGKIESAGSTAVGGVIGATKSINCSITDCTFDGSVIGNTGVGGILGGNDSIGSAIIEGCTVSGSISGTSAVGGIAGNLSNKGDGQEYNIKNCKNDASVSSKLNYCGGIVGKLINSTSWGPPKTDITNSQNNGTVTGGDYSAGIIGYMHIAGGYSYEATVDNNANKASVIGKNYTGGIIGFNDFETEITSAENSGAIKGEAYVGGFVGYGNYTSVSGVKNDQSIEGSYYVGGIMGLGENCNNCHNTGAITATLYDTEKTLTGVGGIAGLANEAHGCTNSGNINSKSGYGVGGILGTNGTDNYDGKFTNCKNSGQITIDSGACKGVGGIIGYFVQTGLRSNTLSISGCENTGNITATTGSGIAGIIGYCKTTDKISIISCTSAANVTADNCEAVGGIVGVNANGTGKYPAKIEIMTVRGTITGKNAVGSIMGSAAKAPENYESIKSTYTVLDSITLPHIGKTVA